MYKFSLLLSVSVLFGTIDACQPNARKEFSIERMQNGTKNLKTNGIFYNNVQQRNGPRVDIIVLYQNGVVFGPTGLIGTQFSAQEGPIQDFFKEIEYSLYKQPVYVWGIYNIKDSLITIESWTGSNGGPYPTRIDQGYILDKETIFFPNSRLDTMRFMPLKEKPDSTNPFVPYEEVQKRKKAIRYEHN